jgi:transcriptional regulator with XRE-family HTH domain
MPVERDLTNANARVAWAIEKVRESGIGLEALAEKIGSTHSTLSLWQTGKTNIENAKVGLLVKFCEATGVSLRWILTGEGPRTDTERGSSTRLDEIATKLKAMETSSPEYFDFVGKMVDNAPSSKPS